MKRAPASGSGPDAAPRVRRGYFESRFGQLHVHNAMPPGGGFDEATALICLHAGGASGRMFRGFLEIMGRDRSAYAPDLPGCGESDPPPARATVADYAAAAGDFLDSMRFRQIDVLGYHLGSTVAAELAAARPQQVRRLVLVGLPASLEPERDAAARERLGAISQPVMVLRPKDDLWESTQRAREHLTRARSVDLPDYGPGIFEAAPRAVADAIRDFLKG